MTHNLKTIKELGTFSELDFTIVGLGQPREIHPGVVDGNYFDVMGLRPVLGRFLGPSDDGPNATGVAVLTFRFWSTSSYSDPSVIGKTVRLGSFEGTRSAVIVGVLEPSVPHLMQTEIITSHQRSFRGLGDRIHGCRGAGSWSGLPLRVIGKYVVDMQLRPLW